MKKLAFALCLILFAGQHLFAQTTCPTFTGTVNQIRALKSSAYCYAASTDYGTGNWYLDTTDHSTRQDVGTVLVDTSLRRWKRIYTGAVFVDWYCIKADGTFDYTNQIDSCFMHAKPYQTISFGNGTYKFSSVSITHTDFTITGNKSLLLGTIVVGNDTPKTYNSIITGLTFTTTGNAINLRNCRKLVISNNVFNNCDTTICVEPVNNSTTHTTGIIEISKGNVFNNVNYCFYVDGSTVAGVWNTTNDCTFAGNVADNCLKIPVYCNGIDGLKYLDNTINTLPGGDVHHLQIDNQSDQIIVNDNKFFESGQEGISLQNCKHLNVNGNNFISSGVSGPYSVIKNSGTTTGIMVNVTGNIINGFSGNVVQIDAPGYGNISVSGNNIYYSNTLPDYSGSTPLSNIQHYVLYAPVNANAIYEKNFFIETTNFHSTYKNLLESKFETLGPYAAKSYVTDTSTFVMLATAVKIAGIYDAGLNPTTFGGLLNITARSGSDPTSGTANYILLINRGNGSSLDSVKVIKQAGQTGGTTASQPSFTFSATGNTLYAIPYGATNGVFYFYIIGEGDLITTYHE